MSNETCGKLFVKVASQDKAAAFLSTLVVLDHAVQNLERQQEVQLKVASIAKQVLGSRKG